MSGAIPTSDRSAPSHGFEPFIGTFGSRSADIRANFDPTFSFNMADFPYIPEPAQTELSPQGSLCPPWTSTELDAWIGTAIPPQAYASGLQTTDENMLFNPAGTNNVGPAFGGCGYGVPVTENLPQQGQPPSQVGVPSNWAMQDTSPMNTSAPACSNGAAALAEGRSAQREALLAAVDRLVHLAALMQ